MANEIIIVIKARNEATGAFEGLKREASLAGDQAGETITERITQKIRVIKDDPTLKQAGAPIGDAIGDTISKRVTEKVKTTVDESFTRDVNGRLRDSLGRFAKDSSDTIHQKVKVDVDVDKKSLLERIKAVFTGDGESTIGERIKAVFTGGAEGIGKEFGDNFRAGFSSVFSGDVISTVIKGALVSALGIGLYGTIGPLIASAFGLAFGGGAIGLGIVSALKDPRIQGAIDGLKKKLGSAFTDFGTPFKGPLIDFFNTLPSVLKPLKPMVDDIAAKLAPVASNLGQGVIGFLQNVLPSIGRMVEKSAPILNVLADKLPGIGDQIGRLLDTLSSHSDDTAQFFDNLLDAIQLLLKFLDFLITVSFGAYKTVRYILSLLADAFADVAVFILDTMGAAFSFIPGWKDKIEGAKQKVRDFSSDVRKQLNQIPDSKTFTMIFRTVGTNVGLGIASIAGMIGKASGGITGSANGSTPSGLTWVGEHGPELISAPAGSRVYSNPDSMRMADGASQGGLVQVNLHLDGHAVAAVVVDPVRKIVSDRFGGNVQAALGKGSAR